MPAVCVYCASAEGIEERHIALAAEVGRRIAKRGWSLVSGGGRRSMMGAVAAAARAGGAHTTGIIPRSMVELEWADHASDELLVVDSMRERKAQMEARADAFLALPGGLGTCEELFEIWTSGYLRLHTKPVVLLDPDGHWAGLLVISDRRLPALDQWPAVVYRPPTLVLGTGCRRGVPRRRQAIAPGFGTFTRVRV